jgi:hypothetical protein
MDKGSIYKDHPPLVNAMRTVRNGIAMMFPYSSTFQSEWFIDAPARITVFHNGVLVQNNADDQRFDALYWFFT